VLAASAETVRFSAADWTIAPVGIAGEHPERSNLMKTCLTEAVVDATSRVVAVPKLLDARSWKTYASADGPRVQVVGDPYTFARVVRWAEVNVIEAATAAPAVAMEITAITRLLLNQFTT